MRRGLKKIISSITMVAVLTSFVIQPAYAATRLTPLHLYRWARINNYSRLHQFKKYINLQDQNHNTALCLAQQAKDQNAYITLLKFGASTDVACHDDDDTICAAIVATEKSSISPAWLLLGAGAIGAAALIGSGGGGGDKEKLCDKNLYPFDETCPDGKVKTEECQDSKGTHLQCICDTNQFPFENSCPTGMISDSTCTDDNGSHHSCICDKSNGYFEDQNECTTNNSGQTGYDCSAQTAEGCYIRTPLSCPLPEVTECEQAKEGIALNDTTTNNFAGESACHNCSYSCDTSKNYDTSCPEGYDCTGSDISQGDASCVKPVACDEKTQYATCLEGKNCSSTTNYGITCYQVLSDKCDRTTYKYDTPCPNTTGLKTIDTCTETTTSGTHTYYQCACDDGDGYYDTSSPITTCGDSGNKGWKFTSNTYNGITCLQCTPLTCDINDGLYSKCTDAKTGIILTPTPSTTDFNGDTPCYECEYDCDIVNNYATSCPSGYSCVGSEVSQGDANCQRPVACNETTQFTTCPDGKNCLPITNYGITCYQVLSDKCDRDIFVYDTPCTDTTGLKTVNTCSEQTANGTFTYYQCACNDASGYYDTTAPITTCGSKGANGWEFITQNYNGINCNTCNKLECAETDYGYGTPNCPTYSDLKGSSSLSATYHGQEQCYTCNYSCKQGLYDDLGECNQDAAAQGKVCTSTTTTVQDGSSITCYAIDTCNPAEYPYDNNCPLGMATIKQCSDANGSHHACICDESSNYFADKTACELNENLEVGYDCSSQTPEGCYLRTALTCEAPSTKACDTAKEGIILDDQLTGKYAGEVECHNCTYTCDTSKNYNTTCPTGYDCTGSSVSQGTTTCVKPVACDETTQYATCPDGKNCSTTTNYGITCYKVLGDTCDRQVYKYDEQCETTEGLKTVDYCDDVTANGTFTYYQCACNDNDKYYDNSTTDLKTCGTSGSNGWIFNSQTYNGITCKTCQMLNCAETDYGYGTPNCPTYTDLKTSSSLSSQYHGNDQCYSCNYTCKDGLYSDEDDCNDDAEVMGKTCTSTTTTVQDGRSYTCYKIDECNPTTYPYDNQCPAGMKEVTECTDDNGSHYSCTCDEDKGYYQDQGKCSLNKNNLVGYDCSNQTTEGCYIRTELTCVDPEVTSCDTAKDGMALNDQLTGKYAGEVECHNCTYTCDTSKNYNTTCPTGYDCTGSSVSQGTTTCVKPVACDETTQYATCPDGKNCSTTTNYGITCYKVLGDTCDRQVYKYDEQCETTEGLKTVDTCNDVTVDGTFTYYQCACDTDKEYYDNSTTDLKTCGDSGSNGWKFVSQNYNGITCKTCQELDCLTTDYGYGAQNCPTVAGLKEKATSSSAYHGNDQCYSCSYTCDPALGYYDNEDDCNDDASVNGKTCASESFTTYNGSVTCYKEATCDKSIYTFDTPCPEGMTKVSECTDTSTHYQCKPVDCSEYPFNSCTLGTKELAPCTTNNATGTAPKTTYKCECNSSKGYYDSTSNLSVCGSSAEKGWEFISGTYNNLTCSTCSELECNNAEGFYETCENAKTGITLTATKSTTNFHGNTACYTCEYTCDTAKNYNTTCPAGYDCTGSNVSQGTATCVKPVACDEETQYATCPDGYNCSSTTNYGITCYKVLGTACDRTVYKYDEQCETTEGLKTADYCDDVTANGTFRYYQCACDTDKEYYDNSTTDLKTCGDSGSNGWEFVSQNYNGITCKTCQELDCLTTDYGYGAQNCPTVAGLTEKATSSSTYHGDDQCYSCSYTCDQKLGYYSDIDDCNDDAAVNGKICASETFTTYNGSITCYKEATCDKSIYTFDSACPEGMTKVSECTDTSTHYQCKPVDCSEYPFNSCTLGTKELAPCTTNNTSGTAPKTTYQCGCDTENKYYETTADVSVCETTGAKGWKLVSGTYNTLTCKTCSELECNNAEGFYSTCESAKTGITLTATKSTTNFHGNTACYTCEYTCDTAKNYNTTCPAGYDCTGSNVSQGTATCVKPVACDEETQYATCPDGYNCSSTTNYGITCYVKLTPKCDRDIYTSSTPCSATYGLTQIDDCKETTTSGTYTYYQCGCDSSKEYYSLGSSITSCGNSGSKGWKLVASSVKDYQNNSCYTCSALTCEENGLSDTCTPAQHGLILEDETSDTHFEGDEECHQCTYSCDQSVDYYPSCPSGYDCGDHVSSQGNASCVTPINCDNNILLDYNHIITGKVYETITDYGLTCYKEKTGCDNSKGYYSTETECITSNQGCSYDTASGCYLRATACPVDEDLSPTDLSICGTYSDYLKATKVKSGTSGASDCYKCEFTCDTTKANVYTSSTACTQNAYGETGYSCTEDTAYGCFIREDVLTCSAPSNTSCEAPQEGFVLDNSPTGSYEGEQPCLACTYSCDETNQYIDTKDYMQCGTSGANGWHFESGTTQAGKTCYKCLENDCPTETTHETCTKVTGLKYKSASTAGITQYHGQTHCHTCEYTCDTSENYYDTIEECEQDSEKTCNTTAVEIYVDLTKKTYYCYQPQGSLASQNSSLEKTTNTTLIELTSSGTEDVYGLKSDKDLQNTSDNTGSNGIIKIDHNSTGYAYGMYGSSNNQLLNDENASINIQNNTSGTAVGMYASRGGSAINKGDITITGTTGTSVGILGAGENYIENQGTINVEGASAYGIRVLDGTNTTIINQGSINVNGTNEAYGIYIDQNASANSVTNLGSITINGNQNDTNRSIVLNGADFRNVGLMSVSGELDLETLGAKTVYLEDGATYEAQSIKGDLTAGVSTVMNDNLDTYIKKDALIAEDTNNLNISSESALFEAKTEKNKEGNTDVVLKRKEFSNFTPNKSMADYLTKNYQAKKFEDTFNSLKSATTQSNLQENLADFMGHDRLLNFADENFSVLRSLNRTMADTILKPTNEKNRVIAGYDNFNLETDDKGVLSGYELNSNSMFTFGDKRLNNWSRLGLGLSFTDINTSYEKGGDRDLNIVSVFVPYLRKISDKLNLVSILNLGYGYGDYDRGSDKQSDIEEIIYGLTNELRYTININGFAELEPALMLNAIGYTEKGFDEGNAKDAIQTKRSNNLSVELGLGVFLKKEVKMEKYGKLGFKIGGVYYHEFADPYRDITLRHKDALGSWYRINDYANLYQRDRAVLEAVIDYAYKDLALYVKYNKLIQKNNPDLFDMGLKFNF